MRRLWALLLALMALVLLAGCVEIEMDAGVDGQNTARLAYRLRVDAGELDAAQRKAVGEALNELAAHYSDTLGFAVRDDSDSNDRNIFDITMVKTAQGADAGQAFDLLREMLADERQTLMMTADLDRIDAGAQQAYTFTGTLALGELLNQANLAQLPPALQQSLRQALAAGGGSFTLTLPASQVDEASHEALLESGAARITAPLSFDTQTEVKLVTRVTSAAGRPVEGGLPEAQRRLQWLQWAAWAAAGLAALLVIAGLAGLARRRRR